MNFVQILDACSNDMKTILSLVQWALNLICWAVPILLIVLTTIDVAKIVTAGNIDDKMKKEVGNKIITRLIYAIVIFLIPTIVSLIFRMLPSSVKTGTSAGDMSWSDCWEAAKKM